METVPGLKEMSKVKVIGIVGGVGSGKSAVAAMFAQLGAVTADADEMCHQLLCRDDIAARVRKRFGPEVFTRAGEIDRKALADRVFQDRARLDALTKILHPPVIKEIRRVVREARRSGRGGAVVLDAALLIETGMEKMCDFVIFVETDPKVREQRVKEERDWETGEIKKREMFQKSVNKKIRMADYIINNSLSKRETFDQVRHIWREIFHEEE